jgi:hypothetical protein
MKEMEMADRFYARCAMCGWCKADGTPPGQPYVVSICESCFVKHGHEQVAAALEHAAIEMGIAHDVTKPITLRIMSRSAARDGSEKN